ncbi:uncharacterized protein [Nicotiana tomentosiformis]|uniref:uncharacterized protein n=1 Tax=Nicotiana tomentosiformis TaxID=4098 RepID=UPI00388CE4C7
MVNSIVKKLNGWHGKLLSYGGKVILIKNVLQAIPTYSLSAMCPPKATFKLIEKHLANFFLGYYRDQKKHDLPDQAFWDLTDNGKYSNKTALHLFRDTKEKDQFLTKLTLPWVNSCDNMMKLQHIPKAISVCWNKPKHGAIKVNTDRSFIHGNGKAGLGGVVRNDQGDLIMAFSIPSKCSNNNMAKAQAAMFGIDWCVQNRFSDFTIELDAMLVMNMLKEGDTNNYRLKKIIKDTSHIMNQANISPVHCFREANEVADSLAKLATTNSEAKVYLSF